MEMTRFVISFIMLCAIIGSSCQYFGNAVDMKVGNHIAKKYSFYPVIFILPFKLPLQIRRILYLQDFL